MMERKTKKYIQSAILFLIPVFIVILAFIIRINVGTVMAVSGRSMEPTFHSSDYILTKRVHNPSEIKEGDIVIFTPTSGVCKGERLVKRVVGVPNTQMTGEDGAPDIVLKDNEYYVMGDNRNNSTDSRSFGPINAEIIKYKYIGLKFSDVVMDIILVVISLTFVCYYYFSSTANATSKKHVVYFGSPGTGKTTFARIYCEKEQQPSNDDKKADTKETKD